MSDMVSFPVRRFNKVLGERYDKAREKVLERRKFKEMQREGSTNMDSEYTQYKMMEAMKKSIK